MNSEAPQKKICEIDAETFLQAIPSPILVVDQLQTIKLANRAFCENFRMTRSAIEGSPISELFKETGPPPLAVTKEFTEIGIRNLLIHSDTIQLNGSNHHCTLLSIEDITDRKRAENEQIRVQNLLHQISDRVPGMVYQYLLRPDGSSCFPYSSEGIRKIYRVSPDDVRTDASGLFKILHPDDYDRIIASIQKSALELSPWSLEYRVKFEDGTIRWLLGNALPQQIADGNTLWHGYITDVTERKAAEQDLIDSEEQYRTLISTALDGLIMVSTEGRIQFVNREAEKMFGRSATELLDQTIETLIPERFHEKHIKERNQYFKNPIPRAMGTNLELFGKRKDGSEFPIDVSLSPIKTRMGSFVTATIRDISARKEIEKERARILIIEKAARNAAEKANQSKDEFLATLSHELRTPLTTILTWAQLLRMGKLDADKAKHAIDVLERSAVAQGQLIDDLLDISRIQAGKLKLSIQKTDPAKIILSAIESIRGPVTQKAIQIETDIDPTIESIYADPMRIQQVLWNLLTNAIKFTPHYGKIWLSLKRRHTHSDEYCFQVRDNGKGIKPEFMPIIFERFTQVDSSTTREYGGLGLGLAIVKRLVEMHEGTIAVESAGENQGSTFTFCIPAVMKIGLSDPVPIDSFSPSSIIEIELKGLNVLLVDDESDAREALVAVLRSFGAKVTAASSAAEAIIAFNEVCPDLLVSDIAMPIEDGYSLIKKIRTSNSKWNQIPAIALTAYAAQQDIQRAHQAGFQLHLSKPIDSAKLLVAITRLVKKSG